MNRRDFQRLARIRLREAKALLDRRCFDGAYYLAGYSVECALKACIAKQTRMHDFPMRDTRDVYSHNLAALAKAANLQQTLNTETASNLQFYGYWSIVGAWSEQSRYQRNPAGAAQELYTAIADPTHGVLQWLERYW